MQSGRQAYALGELLSDFGWAKVWRAVRAADGRSILLKVLESERSGAHDIERLRNEYDIGRALRGSPVLETLGLGIFEGRPALELAAFEGRSLDQLVRAPMPVGDFLRVAISLARAIADIHAHGVIHKDLKPGNVLFEPKRGVVRIGGFSLAVHAASGPTPPELSCIEGSFPYMSPEQTGQMNRAVDFRSDLYSLGIVFYQLLTAQLPFEASDALGWVHCHLARKPVSPDQVSPSVPGALSVLVLKLLAKMPADRYQTAAGLVYDLEVSQRQWQDRRAITPFPLGQHDISDRFLIPHKLYGRERELTALRAALARVSATGTPELLLVSGYAGIGKSTVVRALMQSISNKETLFVSGKCEQHKSDIPYFPIATAFGELMLDIVAEGEEGLAHWRERLAGELGHGAQPIADVIPQIRLILGALPSATLSSTEAEARLRIGFQRLFGALGAAEHPLVLFLDDMQWADAASLGLLVDLTTDGSMRHVLLLGAYRDNEVGSSHGFAQSIARMREAGAVVRDMALGPLSEGDVSQIVADTLHCSSEDANPLARLVCEKTGANPFFTIQFLTMLHRSGAIAFDRVAGTWRWDAAQIRAGGYTDNVAELMVAKLRRLPAEAQSALQMAACMGATVERDTLATALQGDPDAALRPALDEDLLLRTDGAYRFPHDRVQEAAYSLIEEGRRAELHLQTGRRLLGSTRPEALDEKIFEIAGQLDRGASLILSREERERVAELNLRAGRRAKGSAAYTSGATYLAAGMALLDESSWSTHRELAFRLGLERASCELLGGQFDVAERLIAELFPRCASKLDACDVYRVQIDLQNRRSRPSEAVHTALACLRLLGIDMPAHPSWDEVQTEYDAVWRAIGDRPIESLVDLPLLGDPELLTALELLSILKPAAFNFDGRLYFLLVCRMASVSIAHGVTGASADGFSNFGMILGPHFHRYDEGLRFGKLACALVEERGLDRYAAAVSVAMSSTAAWTQPIPVAVDYARKAFDVAIATSELSQACYGAGIAAMELTFSGEPLDSVWRKIDRSLDFVRRVRFRDMVDWVASQQRFVAAMQGRTASLSTFHGEHFDEATFESQLTGTRNSILIAYYWALKLKAHFLAGDYTAALADSQRVAPVRWGMTGQIELVDCTCFTALAAAACCEHATPDEQPRLRELLSEQHRQLEEWAEACPSNFRDKHELVAAEIARLEGRELDAERAYENAIRSAKDSGFVHHEALAYEVAARFYRARSYDDIADVYLRKARDRYRRWGADGKVRQLERLYPQLAEPESLGPATTVALQAEQLDLLSVIKASQTISGAMAKDELLRTLLRVVLEEGHARRACLVLFRQGESGPRPEDWEVMTEWVADEAEAPISDGPSRAMAARVPVSIVQYVRRTQDRVVLDDANADKGRFSSDPYFAQARPRALLCLPVRRQAEAVAALYLENDLVPAAFTRERLLALDLLAAQAAISLENSLLLEREHAGRVEAEAAESRALLLGEATALMSSTLDYEEVFQTLARLCSQSFADWTVIDLDVDGKIVRLAGAHRDPEKDPLLQELADKYPARTPNPIARVIESGAPVCLPSISDEEIERVCVEPRHRELAHMLGTRSAISVPLAARAQRLGALTFAASTPNRFQPADVALAAEIGRRAALSIDNARLLEETRRALRLREEFLAVASHELRTPMTSLRLSVQHLLRSAKLGVTVSAELLARNLERVLSGTNRLEQLTDQLLAVMDIEQGKLELQQTQVDLERLVRHVVEQLERELSSAHCSVSIECAEPTTGRWDAARLGEVVTHLLSNAMKFGAGHPIEIRIGQADRLARLRVTDHGLGIDPARLPRIFERFERGVSSSRYGGLGLGLYLVRSIVLAHGGTIDVESEPGVGTTFTLVLPEAIAGRSGQADRRLPARDAARRELGVPEVADR